jgi:hypothetical protein
MTKIDGFVKSQKTPFSVIPAKAGIQECQGLLDPGFRRGDGLEDFLRGHQNSNDLNDRQLFHCAFNCSCFGHSIIGNSNLFRIWNFDIRI